MRRPRPHRRARRGPDGERGAVLVEFSMVALIIVTLVAGSYDYGMAWRTGLEVTEASRTGARVGSGQGKELNADFSLLSGLRSALSSSGLLAQVQRVVIFQSTADNGRVPADCITTTGTGTACNALTGQQLRDMPTSIGTGTLTSTGCLSASAIKKWCPTTRNNTQLTAQYMGVWVQVRHDYLFRLIGTSTLIEKTTVMRLEPD